MVDYVESTNLGLSTSINARMDVLMGYPNAGLNGTATLTYSNPLTHFADIAIPSPGAKRHLLIIKEVFAPALGRNATVVDINGQLSPAELTEIKSEETLRAEGAFPPEDTNAGGLTPTPAPTP